MRRFWQSLLMATFTVSAAACGGAKPPNPPGPVPAAGFAPAVPNANPASASVPPASSCARRHPGQGAAPASAVRQSSTVALASVARVTDSAGSSSLIAYVADEDEDAIHTLDVDGLTQLAVTPLGGSPAHLLVLSDGRIAATLRDRNRLVLFEPPAHPASPLVELCSIPVAAEPFAIAASPDDQRLVVTSAWGRQLSAFDASDGSLLFTVALPREPRAVVIDDDGRRAFVAHVVGATLSVVDLESDVHGLHSIDLRANKRSGCQGYALAKTSLPETDVTIGAGASRLFAPMVSVEEGEPERISTGYGSSMVDPTEQPLVSVIDMTAERALTREIVRDGLRRSKECLLPRAAVMRGPKSLWVTCLGMDALLELDARALDPARAELRRISVPAGPTGIAIDEKTGRAVVFSQFAHELSIVDLSPRPDASVMRLPLARREGSRITAAITRGRMLFHDTTDPRISADGRACASCHPDGREDALTWSSPEGARQTIMLAGRVTGSEPYGWFGKHKTLAEHLSHTLQRLGGTGLSAPKDRADLDSLIAFLGALRPPTREGAPVDLAKASLIERGRVLFFEPRQGCTSCHLHLGTDQTAHDIGSGRTFESSSMFDTPSLQFVSGTAPYFHDGRYPTLEAVLDGGRDTMGHVTHLSRSDLLALAAYLETL